MLGLAQVQGEGPPAAACLRACPLFCLGSLFFCVLLSSLFPAFRAFVTYPAPSGHGILKEQGASGRHLSPGSAEAIRQGSLLVLGWTARSLILPL